MNPDAPAGRPRHVVVTGGAGRLGRSVVDALLAGGDRVTSVDRSPGPAEPGREGLATVEHDLVDGPATGELFRTLAPDAVVHLAAIAVPFSAPEQRIYAVNTQMAHSVLEAARLAGADRCLLASSPTVIGYGAPRGWTPTHLPLDEEHPLAPWNAYALSKVAVEDLVAMTVRAHGDAFRVGAFRPCYVISPDEWAGAPTQQGHTLHERLADPSLAAVALFNYVDARDAAEFVHRWLDRAGEIDNGEVFFVGAADALATAPLAELLPATVPGTAGLAGALTGSAPAFSVEKARRLLGWEPRRSWRTELARPDSEERDDRG